MAEYRIIDTEDGKFMIGKVTGDRVTLMPGSWAMFGKIKTIETLSIKQFKRVDRVSRNSIKDFL